MQRTATIFLTFFLPLPAWAMSYSAAYVSGGWVYGVSVTNSLYGEDVMVEGTLSGGGIYAHGVDISWFGNAYVEVSSPVPSGDAWGNMTGQHYAYGELGWGYLATTYAWWEYDDPNDPPPGGGGGGGGGSCNPSPGPWIGGINHHPESTTTGYVEIYGANLGPAAAITISDTTNVYHLYHSENQVNVYYEGAGLGWHMVRAWKCGTAMSNEDWFHTSQISDPTPQISSIDPNLWQAGQSVDVTIHGTGFGTNPVVQIDGTGISASIWWASNLMIQMTVTVDANAPGQPNVPVRVVSQGYGGQGFQSTQGNSPVSGALSAQVQGQGPPVSFTISYRAYIPVDHVSGPTPCVYSYIPLIAPFLIYKGDGSSGTYRQAMSVNVVPLMESHSDLQRTTGETRNYGHQSPVNGVTLSAADEDGVPNDCRRFHKADHASTAGLQFGINHAGQYSTVHFFGGAANPLEVPSPDISMDVHVVVNAANPQSPTAKVYYSHDCYPAHEVRVNGQVVYSFSPAQHGTGEIGQCLAGLGSIQGETPVVQVPRQ